MPRATSIRRSSSGTTYYYRVRATNPSATPLHSVTASATPIASRRPCILYHFDEGIGTTAADSAGINTGMLVGTTKPAWVAGRIGSVLFRSAATACTTRPISRPFRSPATWPRTFGTTSTLDVWVKTTQTGSNTHWQAPAITGVDQAGSTSDINWGTLNASGRIGIYVGDSGGVYSTNPINDGQWHNVAMTRDATTGLVQLYVDGVLNGSGTFDVGTKAAQFYLIGALTDRNSGGYVTGANYFNGQLDEVRIYKRRAERDRDRGNRPAPLRARRSHGQHHSRLGLDAADFLGRIRPTSRKMSSRAENRLPAAPSSRSPCSTARKPPTSIRI